MPPRVWCWTGLWGRARGPQGARRHSVGVRSGQGGPSEEATDGVFTLPRDPGYTLSPKVMVLGDGDSGW